MPIPKTNAIRLLERAGVAHRLLDYEVDPAESIARKVGLPADQVFKTLVARGDQRGVCFAVIPGNRSLDLKALARMSGDRKVETVPLKEVQPLTGYTRGGVTALAAKKEFPVYLDENAFHFAAITVSAGRQGCQILLHPDDYLRVVGAVVAAISRPKEPDREVDAWSNP